MSGNRQRDAMTPRVVLHPGLAKTATTTLQRNVFPRHPEIAFIGLPNDDPELTWAIRHVSRADSTVYDAERTGRIFHDRLSRVPDDKVAVFSDENMSLYDSTDSGLVAERLHRIFPRARVLFTLRRQQDFVKAFYLQRLKRYLKGNHYISFDDWFAIKKNQPHKSIFSNIDYYPIIKYYEKLYGKDGILILLFEDLVEDPARFSKQICEFIGVDAEVFERLLAENPKNVGISSQYVSLQRRLGLVLPQAALKWLSRRLPKDRGPRQSVTIRPAHLSYLQKLCGPSNRKLAEEFGIDLAARGYLLDDGSPENVEGPDSSGFAPADEGDAAA